MPVFACKRPILQLFSGSSKKKKLLCLFAYQRYIVGGACTSSASNHSITSGDVAHHGTFMQKSTSTSYCRFVGCGCMKINKLMEEDNLLKLCSLKGCASLVHSGCWQKFVVFELKKPTMVTEVVCSLSHLKQLEKQILNVKKRQGSNINVTKKQRISWNDDGPTPDISSMGSLLDWITTSDNYNRYRGGEGQQGEKKSSVAQEIARFILDQGITTSRTAKDVMEKIQSLEKEHPAAIDWQNGTGAGVEAGSVKEYVVKLCPYFDILDPIMKDKPSMQPSAKFDNSANIDEQLVFPQFFDEASIADPPNSQRDNDDISSHHESDTKSIESCFSTSIRKEEHNCGSFKTPLKRVTTPIPKIIGISGTVPTGDLKPSLGKTHCHKCKGEVTPDYTCP